VLDDHDMVARDGKHRFSARNEIAQRQPQAAHAVGAQLTTLGIPCIYYGTEQAFDGTEGRHDASIEPLAPVGQVPSADRYIREAMFGGEFGAFETGCHFLDPAHPTYLRIARLRNRDDQIGRALRRGRQYWRQIAPALDDPFHFSGPGELVAWSRLLLNQEALIVLNTHGTQPQSAFVTIDAAFHHPGETLTFLYRGDWSEAELRTPPAQTVMVEATADRRSVVRVDLPAAGMAILA
jgi:glycosidase